MAKKRTDTTVRHASNARTRTGVTPGGRPYMATRAGRSGNTFKQTDVALGRNSAGPKATKVTDREIGKTLKTVRAHDAAPERAIAKGPTKSVAAAIKSKSGNFTKGK